MPSCVERRHGTELATMFESLPLLCLRIGKHRHRITNRSEQPRLPDSILSVEGGGASNDLKLDVPDRRRSHKMHSDPAAKWVR